MSNELLPFGTAGGANVMSQADYNLLSARLSGFISGVALSAQLNKVWRQSSFAAAGLGQFMETFSDQDTLDDGDLDRFEANLRRSVRRFGGEFYTAAGTANAITIAPTVEYITLAQMNGMEFRVKAASDNTGPATLKMGALAAKPVVRFDGSPLALKDIVGGDIFAVTYDTTADAFRLQSPRSVVGRGCLLTYEGGGAFASGVQGALPWDTEVYDTDNLHSNSVNPSRITVPAGVSMVRIAAQITYEPNINGSRKMTVVKNAIVEGSGLPAARVPNAGAADVTIINGSGVDVPVSPGDYLEVLCIQDSGTTLPFRAGGNCWVGFSIIR